MAKFALTGMAAVALLGFIAVQVLQRTGRDEAIRDAKRETALGGRGIVAPAIAPGLLAGRPSAIAAMDRVVDRYVRRDPVVRVKIWTTSGKIIYSDEHALIGSTYRLAADDLHALAVGGVDAEISDLTKPENRFERSRHKLLEVYLGIRAAGRALLYEEYLRDSSVAASGRRLWQAFAPALIITLALLELAQIPLAWSLARRLRRGQAEREALLRRSMEASEIERRRIARDLHDGAVQNLAGVSYSLSAAAEAISRGDSAPAAKTVRGAAGHTRQIMRELRTLLVEIYPPNLNRTGLASALGDLVASLPQNGLKADLHIQPDFRAAEHAEPTLYRVAQEALRNVMTHAHASQVDVTAWCEGGQAILTVEDNGRGFVLGPASGTEQRRHFGLRILHDLATDVGGSLQVESEPGAGTRVRIEVPA